MSVHIEGEGYLPLDRGRGCLPWTGWRGYLHLDGEGGTYLVMGKGYLPWTGGGVPTLDSGRGTYPGWGMHTYLVRGRGTYPRMGGRGYLPWTGEGVPTLDGGRGTYPGWGRGYLPWTGGRYLPWTGYATGDTPLAAYHRRTFLFKNSLNFSANALKLLNIAAFSPFLAEMVRIKRHNVQRFLLFCRWCCTLRLVNLVPCSRICYPRI